MQDKQKVTLYLSPELHRKLKIKAAVESEPMSAIAERAIIFYLDNPDVVDEVESTHGSVHQVYSCPGCDSSYVIREGELVALSSQPGVLDEENRVGAVPGVHASDGRQGEEELVPC